MKNKLKMTLILVSCILSSTAIYSQVGVNTLNPDPSSILDIVSSNKGVLIPQYNLIVLNNASSPVLNPKVGTLIYNNGTAQIKGYYYWDGSIWNRLLVNNEMDQIYNIQLPSVIAPFDKQLIPSGTADNLINFTNYADRSIISTIDGASVSGENISLPAGKYKLDIALTVISAANTSTFLSNLSLYALNAELRIGNTPLVPMKYGTNISGITAGTSIQGYRYYFVFELTNATTNIKLNLKHGADRVATSNTNLAHAGLILNFRRFLE